MNVGCTRGVALAALLATSLVAAEAGAEQGLRIAVDWEKLGDLLREGTFLRPQESGRSLSDSRPGGAAPAEGHSFGLSPHLSLVARDWDGAQLLLGRLTLTDQMRLTRSSRMVLTRVRFSDGRIAPFAQGGLGQWRVDTDLMPVLPRDIELAGQLGGGFELTVRPGFVLALESDCTILYREQHEPQMVAAPQLWGAFFASRIVF